MTIEEKLLLIERVDSLIRRKATGTPKDLAQKLNQSERFVYGLLNFMKELGAPIIYCNERRSYCYEFEVEFQLGFVQKGLDIAKIKGGIAKNFDIFLPLHEFCSDSIYL